MSTCDCRYGEACNNCPKKEDVIISSENLNEFWKDIYPHGMTMEKVLDELSDVGMLIEHCTKIYSHFSGGMISKPNTFPSEVIMMSDQREQEEFDEHVEEILNIISDVYDIPLDELKDCV